MNTPYLSIITVTYNAELVLGPTLDSVATQTFRGFVEHIIIDGASKDRTMDLARTYKQEHPEIEVTIMSEPDKGLYDAMNKGLKLAKGEFVCFLNAGDFLPAADTVSKIVGYISLAAGEENMPAVLYGDTDIVDGEGRFLHHRRLSPPENLSWKSFRQGMLVCHQAFYARADFAIATPYDMQYRYSADVDWCIRVMKAAAKENVPLLNLKMVVANYTQEGQTTLHHRESLMERYRVMERHYGRIQTFLLHCWFAVRMLT